MQFEITAEEMAKAKVPHELFLTNLIGNHILWFVASLGIVNSMWQPLALVPVVSCVVLLFTIMRAKKERDRGASWYVMCHWQMAARRSMVFLGVLCLLLVISGLGWVGYTYLGMMKVAVLAIIGGIGLLPTLVSVLVLIVMESDAMHQAAQGKLSKGTFERFPNSDVVVLDEN
ncbi:hypothetical protein DV711_01565 [Motiliproteus coralliicola]|uniref:Uncharacterized protein n=1 Tax=Motiliproteus coralliicola TaxID=2283196 RepID=A0A369WUS0_9GAMM|nr:hypothetical protein [Motiliproteus coralliicola]RDE24304.1 hypothetical protein DV711_01565 [Motiliproteus coralliicola]